MNIQSVTNISKFIEIDTTDNFENKISRQVGYLSASVDKVSQQCVINIQLFEKEKADDYKSEIQKQTQDFFAHLSACVNGSNLDVLNTVFPSDEEVNAKIATMSL